MAENYFNISKGILIGFITYVLSYLSPIYDLLICIGMSFAGNFLWGYIAGLVVQHDSFSFKKAKAALFEAVAYVLLVAGIFYIGDHMQNQVLILHTLSIITWVWLYFYTVNIFKNVKRLFPKSRGLFFIYFVISLEFIKRFPYMKEFIESENQQQTS